MTRNRERHGIDVDQDDELTLASMDRITDSNTFAYSDFMQLTNETQLATFDLSRQYDSFSRSSGYDLSTAGVPPASLQSVSYAYDELGRFSSVSSSVQSASSAVQYSYLEGSSLISGYTNSHGLAVAYEFEDNRNAKTQLLNKFGTTLVSQFDYTYDDLMRRTQRIDTRGTGTPACITNDFGYNTRSEVVSSDMGTERYNYAYDLIGNRLEFNHEGAQGTQSVAYVANQLNQYTQITNNGSQVTMSYDADGNVRSDGTSTYTWNAENRLVSVEPVSPTSGSVKCEFAYDAPRPPHLQRCL